MNSASENGNSEQFVREKFQYVYINFVKTSINNGILNINNKKKWTRVLYYFKIITIEIFFLRSRVKKIIIFFLFNPIFLHDSSGYFWTHFKEGLWFE